MIYFPSPPAPLTLTFAVPPPRCVSPRRPAMSQPYVQHDSIFWARESVSPAPPFRFPFSLSVSPELAASVAAWLTSSRVFTCRTGRDATHWLARGGVVWCGMVRYGVVWCAWVCGAASIDRIAPVSVGGSMTRECLTWCPRV